MKTLWLGVALSFLSLPSLADSCESTIPSAPEWNFVRIILDPNNTSASKSKRLEEACRSFDTSDQFSKYKNDLKKEDGAIIKGIWAVISDIPDAFRNINGNENSEEQKFVNRLKEIKKNPSAVARVQATYNLVIEYQKPFDSELYDAYKNGVHLDRPLVQTPEFTLKHGGVCRDFARVLKWALQQVGRSTSPSKDAEVFTAEVRMGTGKPAGHAWVSVNMPIRDPNGQIAGFGRIDLDPTNAASFTPYPPFAQNLPKAQMNSRFNLCKKIVTCVKKNKIQPTPSSPTKSPKDVIR